MAQKQKEVARVKLNDTSDLVAAIINNEKLDLRIYVNTNSYSGPTKRGVKFYLFDGIWPQFKKLIEKVDKEVKELE